MERLAYFVLLALAFTGRADAAYTITLSGLSPSSVTLGGTRFDFAIAGTPQNSLGDFGQFFNVINVANPLQSGADNGSFRLSENFVITGSGATPGTLSGTLTGIFTVSGSSSFFSGGFTDLTGTGFTVGQISYAPPTAGSALGSQTQGNISFMVTPNAVPEPASMAMLGLGLAGLGIVARRRA